MRPIAGVKQRKQGHTNDRGTLVPTKNHLNKYKIKAIGQNTVRHN